MNRATILLLNRVSPDFNPGAGCSQKWKRETDFNSAAPVRHTGAANNLICEGSHRRKMAMSK